MHGVAYMTNCGHRSAGTECLLWRRKQPFCPHAAQHRYKYTQKKLQIYHNVISLFCHHWRQQCGTLAGVTPPEWHRNMYVGNDTASKNTWTQLWHMEDWWCQVMWHVINSGSPEPCQFNISPLVQPAALHLSHLCFSSMSSHLHRVEPNGRVFVKLNHTFIQSSGGETSIWCVKHCSVHVCLHAVKTSLHNSLRQPNTSPPLPPILAPCIYGLHKQSEIPW